MQARPLGSSGIRVSVVGIGLNNLGRPGAATEEQTGATAVVRAALDSGVTLFDTADIYGKQFGLSETLLGRALGRDRDRAIVATKFGHAQVAAPGMPEVPKGSRVYIRAAIEGSLRRLRTDYLDLFQMHSPDPSTPIEETLGALAELVTEGKVRAIGSSTFDGTQLREAQAAAERLRVPGFVTAQNEYSLLRRGLESDVLPAAEELGLGVLPFYPLFNGLLTGKFARDQRPADSRIARQRPQIADEADWDQLDAYAAFARERGISMLEATFGWLLSRPAIVSVIAGATRPEQIAANAAAGTGWRPTDADLAQIDAIFPAPDLPPPVA